MSRRVCAAKTCYNAYLNKPMLKFFPFPNNEKRTQEWIKNCQRGDLHELPLSKLTKAYFLCSDHFEEKWFINPKFKTKFKPNVEPVPTIFRNNFTEFVPKSIQCKISSRLKDNEMQKIIKNESLENIEEEVVNAEPAEPSFHSEEEKSEVLFCRLCASDVSASEHKNIFSDSNTLLRDMIEYLLPEKVSEDELPHFICSSCEIKVNDCIQTILFFEETYERLKENNNIMLNKHLDKEKVLNFERTKSNNENGLSENMDICFENHSELPTNNEVMYKETNSPEKPGKNFMIKCLYCPAEFNSKAFSKLHERQCYKTLTENSQKEVLLKCNICSKMVSSGRLKFHMGSHTPKENQCKYCGTIYKTKKRLEIHLITHEGDPFCSFCGKGFSSVAQKRLHEKTHEDDRGILCDICGRLFSELRVLDNHMKSHNRSEKFSCNVCNKLFKTESELKSHLVLNPSKFPCPVCNKEFHLKARVQQHLSSHSYSGLYTCFCGISFNRIGNLTQHRKQKHGMDENVERFKCDICKRNFNLEVKLKWHKAKHAGDKKPYDCEVCDKKFGSIANYKNHVRFHTGERPFSCTFCSRTFRRKENLKQHELIHKDIYPHKCPFCDRAFKRLQSLVIHKKTHTGERPFKCDVCEKRFYQKHDLQKHLKVHLKQANNLEVTDDLLSSVRIEKLIELPELPTLNMVSPIPNGYQFFAIDNLPPLSLTPDSDLQLFNLPVVEIQPLIQLSSNDKI